MGEDRTRRLVPGVLSALALLLGLYAILGPPVSTSRPYPSATAAAVLADGAPAAHRTLDPGPQPRLTRHALEKPLLIWAMLLAATACGAALRFVALRHGGAVERFVASPSQEVLLLKVLGLTLLVAGLAQRLQVSAAVGAFLVGIAVSGPLVHDARQLITPLRDLFAAVFFVFFGLHTDPADLPPVAGIAAVLAVGTVTKGATGWLAARRAGVETTGRLRAGTALVARGEFNIVIAGLAVAAGTDSRLGPLAAAYVLILAVAGPLLARTAEPFAQLVRGRRAALRSR